MLKQHQKLKFSPSMNNNYQGWQGDLNTVSFDAKNIKNKLMNLDCPCYILNKEGQIGISNEGSISYSANGKTQKLEMLLTVSSSPSRGTSPRPPGPMPSSDCEF